MLFLLTPEESGIYEANITNHLFTEGLGGLILRLPQKEIEAYTQFLDHIEPQYRSKILVANFHKELIERYAIGGCYCPNSQIGQAYKALAELTEERDMALAVGIHSLEELSALPTPPTFALLSPVFQSISKEGYQSNPQLSKIGPTLQEISTSSILAMGGITADKMDQIYQWGYDGAAILGDIWGKRGQECFTFQQYERPKVMSIGGVDPSGGAGIVADVKVTSNFGIDCISIPLSLTIQSEDRVEGVSSLEIEEVLQNIRLNSVKRDIRIAKIGLACALSDILRVVIELKACGVKYIIWDPIIKTTANNYRVLHNNDLLPKILKRVDLITPNSEEAEEWFGTLSESDLQEVAESYHLNILLKGGHTKDKAYTTDLLYRPLRKAIKRYRRGRSGYPKHGTGCMLASAIMSHLITGRAITYAATSSQVFIAQTMTKSRGLIARLPIDIHRAKIRQIQETYQLQYVTNTTDEKRLLSLCEVALKAGLRWIQLRMKNASTIERIRVAKKIKELSQPYSATLIIDDDVEAVIGADADGVHLGLEDMQPLEARRRLGADKIIGLTCNQAQHIQRAAEAGADYIGVGPFRMTRTKEKLAPILGVSGLSELVKYHTDLPYPMPMVTIGGITCNDIEDLKEIGVSGFALSGEIEHAPSVDTTVQNLLKKIKKPSNL